MEKFIVITNTISIEVKKPILYTDDKNCCLCKLENGALTCIQNEAYFSKLSDEKKDEIVKKF